MTPTSTRETMYTSSRAIPGAALDATTGSLERRFATAGDRRVRMPRWALGVASALIAVVASACGSAGDETPSDQSPAQIGLPNQKPGADGSFYDGALYLVDPHDGGKAKDFRIVGGAWGRLVDVFDFDSATGATNLLYPEFVVGEDVRTVPGKWTLTSNPVTGASRLTLLVAKTATAGDAFDLLLQEARSNLSPVLTKGLQPGEVPPYTVLARNSVLELQFNDLIDPSTVLLNETVRVLVGNPPTTPFSARVVPSTNFGGVSSSGFFSTRLLFDFTISEFESVAMGGGMPLNGLGLPASLSLSAPNVALRFPTQLNPSVGQFRLLRNLGGETLVLNGNGPVDTNSPTLDIVRALRSGGALDANNGFLLDLDPPRVVASQRIAVASASPDPAGLPGFDFVVSFTFETPTCAFNPQPADALQFGPGIAVEVTQPGSASAGGAVNGLRVRAPVLGEPLSASDLLGTASFLTAYKTEFAAQGKAPCFLRFVPEAGEPPIGKVAQNAGVVVRFSEAIDPVTVRPFDSMRVLRVGSGTVGVKDFVVGEVFPAGDQREFRLQPSLDFAHNGTGTADPSYFFNLIGGATGVRDLAGNPIAAALPPVEFKVAAVGPAVNSRGFALRFNNPTFEEVEPNQGRADFVGQVLFDPTKGALRPRTPVRFAASADRSQALVGAMQQIPTGVVTPLSALGSRLQHAWRYSDFGFTVSETDFTQLDLDVEGVALAPLSGQVVAANYPQFEIRLAHSQGLPEERLDASTGFPAFLTSGLRGQQPNEPWSVNILNDPVSSQKVVHERAKGFAVSQSDVFVNIAGVNMLRMPLNKGAVTDAEKQFYTWRDTTVLTKGGKAQSGAHAHPTIVPPPPFPPIPGGIPHAQEIALVFGGVPPVGSPFFGSNLPPTSNGLGGIPSVGLPLLIEYRTFPTETSSLNVFDISIAVTSSARPGFRAFSTGGVNTAGNPVTKDPDTQTSPTGGFQAVPNSTPAVGEPTAGIDPSVYIGQADVVLRVSRMFTRLIDLSLPSSVKALVVEPRPADQPAGTSLTFAWRGLGGTIASTSPPGFAFNALNLNVYGDTRKSSPPTGNPVTGAAAASVELFGAPWRTTLATIQTVGQTPPRYLQTRVTFISNTATQLSPRLDSYGLAYTQ